MKIQISKGQALPTNMNQRRRIKKYLSMAIVFAIFFIANPELRSFLWTVDALGLDLVIVVFGLQLRLLLLTMPIMATRARAATCAAIYGLLRIGSRVLLIFTPPSRATYGFSLFLNACSKSLWCPTAVSNTRI
jgi:hypothetical protein